MSGTKKERILFKKKVYPGIKRDDLHYTLCCPIHYDTHKVLVVICALSSKNVLLPSRVYDYGLAYLVDVQRNLNI